ncbi:hypothetical protein ACHAXT_010729 [Thalassiosira profunda]
MVPWKHLGNEPFGFQGNDLHGAYFGRHFYGLQFMTCYECLKTFQETGDCRTKDGAYQKSSCFYCEKIFSCTKYYRTYPIS